MVLLDDQVYQETKDIVLGKREKSRLLIELSDWCRTCFSVSVLNFQFKKLPGTTTNRYRLEVILENTEDYRKMSPRPFEPNLAYESQLALEFRKLAVKHLFADESKLENIFVIYNDFSDEARTEVNWKAAKDIKASIKERYSNVWEVLAMFSNSVVFYYSEADIAANKSNGISEAITDVYYSILKKYDELNYFTCENICLKFDSKENVDQNHQGNLFLYSR